MDAILALDAGGSKCDALLTDLDGTILGSGSACQPGVSGRGPQSIGRAALQALTARRFRTLVLAAPFAALPPEVAAAVVVGNLHHVPCNEVDPALIHAGVDCGVVLLAGTGAFAHGRTRDGRRRHLDGTGPILGDFGGGYHIGTMALHAIVRSDWHPRHATALRGRVLERFGVSSPYALFNLNLFGQDRSVVASIARTVIEEAERGDAVSVRILQQAAHSMGETFADLVHTLGMAAETYTVVGTGSIMRRSDLYWESLCERIRAVAPGHVPHRLAEPPVFSYTVSALHNLRGAAAAAAVRRLLTAAPRECNGTQASGLTPPRREAAAPAETP